MRINNRLERQDRNTRWRHRRIEKISGAIHPAFVRRRGDYALHSASPTAHSLLTQLVLAYVRRVELRQPTRLVSSIYSFFFMASAALLVTSFTAPFASPMAFWAPPFSSQAAPSVLSFSDPAALPIPCFAFPMASLGRPLVYLLCWAHRCRPVICCCLLDSLIRSKRNARRPCHRGASRGSSRREEPR
jgi:hypothetical protein